MPCGAGFLRGELSTIHLCFPCSLKTETRELSWFQAGIADNQVRSPCPGRGWVSALQGQSLPGLPDLTARSATRP